MIQKRYLVEILAVKLSRNTCLEAFMRLLKAGLDMIITFFDLLYYYLHASSTSFSLAKYFYIHALDIPLLSGTMGFLQLTRF